MTDKPTPIRAEVIKCQPMPEGRWHVVLDGETLGMFHAESEAVIERDKQNRRLVASAKAAN